MGRADRPKVKIKIHGQNLNVLSFNQGAPFFASKGAYYSQKNNPRKALLYLQRAVEAEPDDPLNHYNLACLLSRLDHLQEANSIFRHIVKNMDPELSECHFYMAVNHGLMEDLPAAKRCLLKYLHESPEGEMAEEAEDLLIAMEDDDDLEIYNRSLSADEHEAMLELIEDLKKVKFKRRLLEEKSFRKTLHWGLYQGGDTLKEAIISFYGELQCDMAKQNLLRFVANPWVNERLRQVALQELKRIDPDGSCRIYKDGEFVQVSLRDLPKASPTWESGWQQVLECVLGNMNHSAYYSQDFYNDVEAIWFDYLNRVYPEGPRITKPQTWAAGLEYCLSRFHFLGLTQKDLAAAYGVSAESVRRKFAEINAVLEIDRKAYRNMLTYFTDREGEGY